MQAFGWSWVCIIAVVVAAEIIPHSRSLTTDDWQLGPFIKQDNVNPVLDKLNTTIFFCPMRQEDVYWEAKDVFNPTALVRDGKIHLLYRAEDEVGEFHGTSRIGLATSEDGLTFVRESEPIFYPDHDAQTQYEWEGGCEDPRIVEDDSGMYYMTYTAYDGTVARLLIATSPNLRVWMKHGPIFKSTNNESFINLWSKSGSIVTTLVDEKFVATRIGGLYWMYWGDTDIYYATSADLVNWTPGIDEVTHELVTVLGPRPGMFDSDLVEPGPQAIITEDGILLVYNGRNKAELDGGDPTLAEGTYSAGQILLNRTHPWLPIEGKRSMEYFMTPDKDYEIIGQIGNVVFLEGLVQYKGDWFMYYGTADSRIAVAVHRRDYWQLGPFVKQDDVNPIMDKLNTTTFMCPVRQENVLWEAKDVFNPTALVRDGKVYMLYRAEDDVGVHNGTSRIGLAVSEDGYTFVREPEPIFYPDNDVHNAYEWEGGCEDPRIIEDEEGTYYMTYTAYDGELARLFVASSSDLRTWVKHGSVFQAANATFIDLWSKAGSIVTSLVGNRFVATRINGMYWMYWGESNIFYATSTDLINWTPGLDEVTHELVAAFGPREDKFDSDIVEPGPQAVIMAEGILLVYNGRNKAPDAGGDPDLFERTYSGGQILLNKTHPWLPLEGKRSEEYFMTPDRDYEIIGQIGNVVFLEGLVFFQEKWFLYYGTADSRIAVAVHTVPQEPPTTTTARTTTTEAPVLTTRGAGNQLVTNYMQIFLFPALIKYALHLMWVN